MSYDITFCRNYEKCPKKEKCERAYPTVSKAFPLSFADFYKEGKDCEFFINNKPL